MPCPPVHAISSFIFLLFLVCCDSMAQAEQRNLTDRVQYLGNPYLDRYPAQGQIYARNIWDMIAFDGKLYLGAGNSSNTGPAPNAGPVPIMRYDPRTLSFSTVFIVDEEQVDVFYEFGKKLYIPGHDPKEDWQFGNLYTYSDEESWRKQRNIPGAVHAYALAMHQGKLFAGLGTKNANSIAVLSDDGKSWKQFPTGTGRIYDFLIVDGQLLALGPLYSKPFAEQFKGLPTFINTPVHQFTNGTFSVREDFVSPETLFPDTDLELIKVAKIFKGTAFHGKGLYIGARKHNDHHALPFGAYIASSLAEENVAIEKISLPADCRPWDILVKGDSILLLAERKQSGFTEVSVWQSGDGKNWNELFYFEHATFARSFEFIDDYFYFSSGSEFYGENFQNETLSPDTGKVFRMHFPATALSRQKVPRER